MREGNTDCRQLLLENSALRRALQTRSACMRAIVHAGDEAELLDAICRIVVEIGGYRLAWVGYKEQDEAKTVRPVAQAGFEEGYLDTVRITWADTERGRGPTGTGIRTGRPVTTRNMLTDPNYHPWRAEAQRRGYASSLVLPLSLDRETFGALNIYSAEPDAFDAGEVALLSELVDDLVYGISNQRIRVERRHAEEERLSCQKRMEKALRESELKHRMLFETAGDAILLMRHDSFLDCNARTLEVFGCTREQIIGAPPYEFSPQEQPDGRSSREKALENIRLAIEQGPQSFEWVHCRADRSTFPAEVSLNRLELGGELLIQAIVRDITERKRIQEDLRHHAEQMEQRVRARTAQLAARNQELKDFAYTVSHDLKAPLRGIAGYANELNRKHRVGLSDRAQFCLAQILTATSHLDALIEDLLRYSRLEAETPTLNPVDLRALVEAILHDRELILTEQHVELTVDVATPPLLAWERGLVPVLSNLIDNAIKYSRNSDPPRLHISAALLDRALRLSVGDNGIGFDMKYHDRIFGLFNRLVRMEDYEGTGAGLAIAKKVLDRQGGRIWAESAPGQGSTFFVEIPTWHQPDGIGKEDVHEERPGQE